MPSVDWMQLVASMTSSLAWPISAFAITFLFRARIRELLSESALRRVKAGPFEAEWQEAEKVVPPEVRSAAQSIEPVRAERLSARVSPRATILERFSTIESRLAEVLVAGGMQPLESFIQNVHRATDAGLVSESTAKALVGVSVLRNLTAHSPDGVDAEKAQEFLALADAVEFALDGASAPGSADSSGRVNLT